jgi:NTE family protein
LAKAKPTSPKAPFIAGSDSRTINLALQGGGSHGAFTWGVLDRILDEKRLIIDAISGTSAGAVNGALLADGLVRGGPAVARERMRAFWQEIAAQAARSPVLQRTPFSVLTGNWTLHDSPGYIWMDLMGRLVSPYEFNPFDLNPLRDLLETQIDFTQVRACDRLRLFVTATNVHSGRPKVFRHHELTVDAILASTCLPHLFRAVEIDGIPYWDGGYMGNPTLWPLIYNAETRDLVIVQINPLEREETPKKARDIADRVSEITFNHALFAEMRAIAFIGRLIEQGKLDAEEYKQLFIHRIHAEDQMKQLDPSSKLNGEMAFLDYLHGTGMRAADAWIERNFDKLGKESSVDIRSTYL